MKTITEMHVGRYNSVPTNVLRVELGWPLVMATGGSNVTEAFYDADHAAAVRAGLTVSGYDFISGEPYARWM